MATLTSTIVTRVRNNLQESTARLWTDAEILDKVNGAYKDLWRAINNTYQNYWLTVDITSMSIAANGTTVTGVPSDFTTLKGMEPLTQSLARTLKFTYRDYNHPDFIEARTMDAVDPTAINEMFVAVTSRGGPVSAPTIHVAPSPTSAITLRVSYVPTQADLAAGDNNPIPGESDKAVEYYATAYALAKLDEGKAPNADWLALYATEKTNILTFLAPRQEMDQVVAEGMWEGCT